MEEMECGVRVSGMEYSKESGYGDCCDCFWQYSIGMKRVEGTGVKGMKGDP